MQKSTSNKFVAQGAEAWQEKEIHDQIISDLNDVWGKQDSYFQINGYVYAWYVKVLPETRLLEIVNRGRHDEIMYMIKRYQQANCPPEKRSFLHKVQRTTLPESVQQAIARRNNMEEMDSFLSYEGFGPAGQSVILQRNNHAEIMNYLQRHGFDAQHIRQLFARNNMEEIALQTQKHGWPDEVMDEMFADLEHKLSKGLWGYYLYISHREFSEKYQKKMLMVVATKEFEAYVDKYGLWNNLHQDLITYRNMPEVHYYLERHPYLNYWGCLALAQKGSHNDKMFYISVLRTPSNDFLWAMFKVKPLDYEALSACFLKVFPSDNENMNDIELMKNGTHEQVMFRIRQKKLGNRALAALFFRNNQAEFEEYLRLWEQF